jgi:ABC-type multidrug transport system ATPase subunit
MVLFVILIVSRIISDVALAQNLVGSALTNVWMDGAAIDATSEKLIQDALEKLRIGRTTLIIAHRLSTIINADKIIVLDDGEIVEMGTHDELLQHGGVYHSLYMQQFALALSLPAPAVASAGGGGPKNGRGADVDPVPVGRLPVVER